MRNAQITRTLRTVKVWSPVRQTKHMKRYELESYSLGG